MINIGKTIRAVRIEKGLTISELCSEICSDRFLYMIEKGEKYPSCHIVSEFNKKLDLNLFEYIDYCDCDQPITSKIYIDRSRVLRSKHDIEELEQVLNAMRFMSDFNKTQYMAELYINEAYIQMFKCKAFDKAIELICDSFKKSSDMTIENIFKRDYTTSDYNTIRLLNLLQMCYRNVKDNEKASQVLEIIMTSIDSMKFNSNHLALYISIQNNYYFNKIIIEKSINHLNEVNALLEFEFDHYCLNQLFFTYYIVAGHYYNLLDYSKSRYYFKKSIALCNSLNNAKHYSDFIGSLSSSFINEICPEGFVTIKISNL